MPERGKGRGKWIEIEKKNNPCDQWGCTDGNTVDGANLHMWLSINLLKGISNATLGAAISNSYHTETKLFFFFLNKKKKFRLWWRGTE